MPVIAMPVPGRALQYQASTMPVPGQYQAVRCSTRPGHAMRVPSHAWPCAAVPGLAMPCEYQAMPGHAMPCDAMRVPSHAWPGQASTRPCLAMPGGLGLVASGLASDHPRPRFLKEQVPVPNICEHIFFSGHTPPPTKNQKRARQTPSQTYFFRANVC